MSNRYSQEAAIGEPKKAEGWVLERLTPASRLFGANGLRTGPDGRIYVAQAIGSQVSAIDVNTGQVETISAKGSEIVAPDDLVFDAQGNLYVTETMDGRVARIGIDGGRSVVCGDLPSANGITIHQGRLFVDEWRPGGRLLELSLDGGAPRVVVDDLPMPNGFAAGPDGLLYFPVMGANEIWRVHPDGGAPERVVGDLGLADAVKFDAEGFIVSTQVKTGEVLRIHPRNAQKTLLATVNPGLDNLTFVGNRLFVSTLIDGKITEILAGGETKDLLPGGLCWPLDLVVGADGDLLVIDGSAIYGVRPGEQIRYVASLFDPGYLGSLRCATALADGGLGVTVTNGIVGLYWPVEGRSEVLAEGLDEPYGIAARSDGAFVVVERGAGRLLLIERGKSPQILASGLADPMGVAIGPDGAVYLSEAGLGRVAKVTSRGLETVFEGLRNPQGLLVRGNLLDVLDVGAKVLVEYDLSTGAKAIIASDLPVGAPAGVVPKILRGVPGFSGPIGPFAGIAAGADGTLLVSADGEGSVLAIRSVAGA